MAPAHHLAASLVSLLFFILAALTAAYGSDSPTPESKALAQRPAHFSPAAQRIPPPRYFPRFSAPEPDLTADLELLDIVLIASIDGKFHALNRTSGQTLWSMPSLPLSTPGPLVRTDHIDHNPEEDDTHHEMYIIEPQSGDIYVLASPNSPLQRFPVSMRELVDNSPYTFKGEDHDRVFVGRKQTTLLVVELETGKVKATLSPECPYDPFEDFRDDEDETEDEVDLDELEGSKPPVSKRTEVFIGRTDYHISIYHRPHSRSSPRPPPQNLSFSAYGPNNHDLPIQTTYHRTKDGSYIQPFPNGEILSFKSTSHAPPSTHSNGHLMWQQSFDAPVVAIFDVLRNATGEERAPFVLLQPSPKLQDVLPGLNLASGSAIAGLKLDSAYVGLVEETGSLFAMSPERYPLVVFGSGERRADVQDTPHKLLEGPLGKGKVVIVDPSADVDDEPLEVDEITRIRKKRQRQQRLQDELCLTSEGKLDRRCLTGVRKLEDGGAESRINRLLEGPRRWTAIEAGEEGNGSVVESGDDERVEEGKEERRGRWWEVGLGMGVGAFGVVGWFVRTKGRGMKVSGKVLEIKDEVRAEVITGQKIEDVVKSVEEIMDLQRPSTPLSEPPPPITREASGSSSISVSTPISTTPTTPRSKEREKGLPSTPVLLLKDVSEEGEEEENDNDAEGDAATTPGAKKKGRRGKRGRKKKPSQLAPAGEYIEEKVEEKKEEPRQLSLAINTSPPVPQVAVPSLLDVTDTILGYGSHGTVVYKGSLQGRSVAVKRLLRDFVTLASREVSILQESDDHPNVIRYYYQESHSNFLFIALELCPCSLADIIEMPDRDEWRDIAISFDPKKALKQITSGLRHLHALKLVHRDIKPQNILVGGDPRKGGYRMLISDFGLCKKLDVDQTSFLPTAHGAMGAGTVGWRAPEILRGEVKLDDINDDTSLSSRGSVATVNGSTPTTATPNGKPTRLTKSVDIFALGCLFYYTLTSGSHPFGDRFEREVNILKNAKNLDMLETFGEDGTEAVDLINAMLDPEASERPDTTTCLLHPYFWDAGRRLNFLQEASDRFENMCRDPKDARLLVLETNALGIVGNDWQSRLDKVFIENLGKFRKYDGKSVQDLLRALRNKKHHYQDLPDNAKRNLGSLPDGFLSYFTKRYPRLFLHVHSVINDTELKSESMFRTYYELPDT
ncbi:hypothetical protein BDQ17DRAFT_1405458 [Cyathus striatus]|nr:hypothetical protein BDQ17DRAFT_1405458 [Cyathus striatus]